MSVTFKDNTLEITEMLEKEAIAFLHEAGGELLTQVRRNTRVDTGQLKNSWKLVVDEKNLIAIVGSPLENAIWEEFGTGEFALNGNGRKKIPWKYQDVRGKWHTTTGKKPSRALFKAFNTTKPKIIRRLNSIGKGF